MKYCEKCSAIFKNSGQNCPKCRRKLTENIYPENLVYMTTATGFELERIESALKEVDIPYTRKSPKMQIAMRLLNSAPAENCDILVPIFAYDDAYTVLAGIGAIDPEKSLEPDESMLKEIRAARKKHNGDIDSMSPRKRILIKVLSLFGFLLLLALVTWGTDYLILLIKNLFGM